MTAPHAAPHGRANEESHASPHSGPHASAHAEATHEKAASHESAKHESAHETAQESKKENEHEAGAEHRAAEGKNAAEGRHAEEGKSAKEAVESHHGEESAAHGNATSEGNKQGHGAVSGAHAFANPRKAPPVKPGSKPHFTSARPGALSYRRGANNIPHAGAKGKGRAGIFDPGGYVRNGKSGSPPFERNRIQQQLSSIPNYQRNFAANNRARIEDRSHWPHQWNPGPQGSGLGYYHGYNWNGTNYPFNYYSMQGYSPTPYLFLLESGAFWQPGAGYSYNLPYGYNQPMSVGINEVVPEYDANGNIIGYGNQTFYYNAIWDAGEQAYGYYDYFGKFHWLTFPWLNSWGGAL
jgi:hypothetical protein